MRRSALFAMALCMAMPAWASAQELVEDTRESLKARVVEVLDQKTAPVPGTDVEAVYQTIRVEILQGERKGEQVVVENDYLALEEDDLFYLTHTTNALDGVDYYTVGEPYRLPALMLLTGLFIAVVIIFGGKQGIRGLLSLVASLIFIVLLLLPGVMNGYPPALVAVGVASLIVLIGSYVTHGFNKMTTTAVIGMVATIIMTGMLASLSIWSANLSGFTGEETTYLHLNARGTLDLAGLLLGGILIGLLGVLYDAAIGQSVAVEELGRAAPHMKRRDIYLRALRIGREHIGALVNTLAIAYVGASLPLLLLFYSSQEFALAEMLNRELFAAEIVRILVGSIGVVLVVPITTLVAVLMLLKDKGQEDKTQDVRYEGHAHGHGHVH